MESNQAASAEQRLAELERLEHETWFPPQPAADEVPSLGQRIFGGAVAVVVAVAFLATWLWLQARTDNSWWVVLGGLSIFFGAFAMLQRSAARSTGVRHRFVMPRRVYRHYAVDLIPTWIGCFVMTLATTRAIDRSADWWVFAAIIGTFFAVAVPVQMLWSHRRKNSREQNHGS